MFLAASLAKPNAEATASNEKKDSIREIIEAVLGKCTRRSRLLRPAGRSNPVRMLANNITTRAQPQALAVSESFARAATTLNRYRRTALTLHPNQDIAQAPILAPDRFRCISE